MRDTWGKSADLGLSIEDVQQLVEPVFPQQRVVNYGVVTGGLANANVRVVFESVDRPLLLKIYLRGAEAGRKESALSKLIVGRVPAPRFLHFGENNPVTGHAYAVIEWMDGERLELSSTPELAAQSVGSALAGMHSIHFDQTGFFGPDLSVAEPIDVGSAGLAGFLRYCLIDGRGAKRIDTELVARLMRFAERESSTDQGYDGPPCLTHCDFGGSNILVQGGQVTAVIDWEFAISGSSFFDFGNLLRPPLGDNSAFVTGLEEGYRAAGGALPIDWRRRSMIVDLTAWADFLNRENVSEGLVADARRMIVRTLDLCESGA